MPPPPPYPKPIISYLPYFGIQHEPDRHGGTLLAQHEAAQRTAVAVLFQADGPLASDADVRCCARWDTPRPSLQNLTTEYAPGVGDRVSYLLRSTAP